MSTQETMRGVVRTGKRAVEVVDLPRPQLEPGTALVRVVASGVCGSDLHEYRRSDKREARPAGHEVAGEVLALHARDGETPRVREGDLVAIDTICLGKACGECRWCREGAPVHCQSKRNGSGWSGAFAEYIMRDLHGLFPLPQNVTAAEGAMVEPLAVAVHAVRLAQLKPGETVAIVGAGTIGLNCVLAALGLGAGAVYIAARHSHQAEMATSLGAAGAFTGSAEETESQVRQATGGLGADLVIETVGGEGATLDQAFGLVRRRGRVAVLGLFLHPVPVNLAPPLHKEVTVFFPDCYGEIDGRHDYEVAIDLIASGKAKVSRLLTHTFSLDDAPKAFKTADDKSSGSIKVQLEMPR